jgi:restriction system protein
MARGSGSSGGSYSYREWAAAERADQREREQRERKAEKSRVAVQVAARDAEAAARTEATERRVAELESLLRSSLIRDPRISFDSLKITATVPPLNLGAVADPIPAPRWADFAPKPPSGLGRMFGGSQRYQASYQAAERAFATAQADHQRQEAGRQRKVAETRGRLDQESRRRQAQG